MEDGTMATEFGGLVFVLNICTKCGQDVECLEHQTDYVCDDCLPPDIEMDERDMGRLGDDE
jgi:anaerobic ribonucleoside-triphosphate reductase